jgi:hypothetical protein
MAIDITSAQIDAVKGDQSTGAALLKSNCRLLVNAAFLQEIKDSNPDLAHAMHALRQTCESEDPQIQVVRELVRQLDDLRDRWAIQFALEESYGYIRVPITPSYPGSIDSHPRWKSEQAEAVLGQHCTLYLMIHDLAERAEELQYRGVTTAQLRQLIARSRAFDEAIRDHEAKEADLMLDA